MREVREKRIKLSDRKQNMLISAGLVLAALLVFVILFPIGYETNDDIGMSQIIYGASTHYDTHLIYINVLIGYLLKGLLTILPAVPWYPLLQVGLILLSFYIIFYLILNKLGKRRGIPVCLILWVTFGYQFLTLLQFSKTAGITVTAGMLLLLCLDRKWYHSVSGVLLVFTGSLYRFKIFEMLMIAWFGAGLFFVWQLWKKKNWKKIVRTVILFVLLFAGCFGANAFNRSYYQKAADWSSYVEYNNLRSKLIDYGFPEYEENEKLYQELGLTEEDIALYQNWDFADSELFTTETMKKLVAAQPERESVRKGLGGYISEMIPGLTKYSYFGLFLMAMLWTWKKRQSGKWETRLLMIYELAAVLGIEFYIYLAGRYLLNRIDVPIFLSVILILIYYGSDGLEETEPEQKLVAAGAVAVCCLMIPVLSTAVQNRLYLHSQKTADAVYELIETDQKHLYFITEKSSKINREFAVWEVPEESEDSNMVSLGGWKTESPIMYNIWQEYAITNPFPNMVNNQEVYLVSNRGADDILEYIQRHYVENAQTCCVKSLENGFGVYRIFCGEIELDTEKAVPADSSVISELTFCEEGGAISLKGLLYKENENSYASNLYIALKDDMGEETIYYGTQRKWKETDDLMNGAYGAFACRFPGEGIQNGIVLYLETDDALYRREIPYEELKFEQKEQEL